MKQYYDTDIIEMNSKGILFHDNYFMSFDESRNEWLKKYNLKETTCVAERYGEDGKYYFIFRGREDIKVGFNVKGFFVNKKRRKKFQIFQAELRKGMK